MSKPKPTDNLPAISPVELHRLVDLDEASRLAGGLSKDTLKRHHADKIRRLSPRRLAMRVGDALALRAAEVLPEAS